MKLNQKGFAISIMLYSMVILIMGVLYLLIGILNYRYKMSKTIKEDVVEYINSQEISDLEQNLENKKLVNIILNSGNCYYQQNNCYYYGSNPNNYVYFNGELWRIIGVIEINDLKYVKIIRNSSLDNITLNNYQITRSNLFTYLNNDYYNTLDNTFNSQAYLHKTSWKNAEYSPNMMPNTAYFNEKNSSNSKEGYVGLINGSDFGYTAGSTYLNNNLSTYSISYSNNWLNFNNSYFTMSYYNQKINIVSNGNLINTSDFNAYIYPVVYLKRNVFLKSGNGGELSPYTLSLS